MNKIEITLNRQEVIDDHLVQQYFLHEGTRLAGEYRSFKDGNRVFFDYEIYDVEKDSRTRNASLVVNHIITSQKPEKIVFVGSDDDLKERLFRQLFVQEDGYLVRTVEPYRYLIPNTAFDEEGFIVNQAQTENIRFGFLSSKRNGCGWISAYNLLKLNGKEHTIEDTSTSLSYQNLLGEVFGESVYRLYAYLRKEGLPVRITHALKAICLRNMNRSSSGIMLYFHKKGSHFVTYRKVSDGRYHFYNAVYGDRTTVLTPEEFTKKFTISPLSFLIWIPEKK